MYMLYSPKKNWRTSIASESPTDLGGFRDIVLHIDGKNVFGHLKQESGVHRVQRVPSTETQGRIHTSTATIAVFPEADEVEFTVNPSDLRIDVYRASGAGGQHVNTTDSAVRITHIPTGVVVACQDERSQHKNKAKALKELQSRLYSSHKEKQDAEMAAQRKEQVGSATRSEKVRTYNYPQNRVTDHQAEVTLNKLDIIMEGNLDDIIEPLMKKDLEERRKKALSSNF
jgi:peptide chain release factor 1